MKKILERLDFLLATRTVVVFGATMAIAGAYLVMQEGKNWGIWLFLPGFVLGLYAANRVGRINKRLSKDLNGIVWRVMLVIAVAGAVIATLNQVNIDSLLAIAGMFIFSLGFEVYLVQEEHMDVSG